MIQTWIYIRGHNPRGYDRFLLYQGVLIPRLVPDLSINKL